jgi:hypothetical protein
MMKKIQQAFLLAGLIVIGWLWVLGWSASWGQVAGQQGPSTGTGYPSGAQNLQVAATGTTAAVAATLPAQVGQFTYICGFAVTPGSATTAIVNTVTVTGLDATFNYTTASPTTGAGATGTVLLQNFTPCLPASAINTAIVVTQSALGAGGANADVNAWGYQLAQ